MRTTASFIGVFSPDSGLQEPLSKHHASDWSQPDSSKIRAASRNKRAHFALARQWTHSAKPFIPHAAFCTHSVGVPFVVSLSNHIEAVRSDGRGGSPQPIDAYFSNQIPSLSPTLKGAPASSRSALTRARIRSTEPRSTPSSCPPWPVSCFVVSPG